MCQVEVQSESSFLLAWTVWENSHSGEKHILKNSWEVKVRVEGSEVLTDSETTLKNRPFTYTKEHIQFPVLTPNSHVFSTRSL